MTQSSSPRSRAKAGAMHEHAIAANTDDNLKSFPDPNISSELLQGAAEREHFIESLVELQQTAPQAGLSSLRFQLNETRDQQP